jgi:pimeloyl-ACP methyl ester carboxylesterase
MSLTSPRISHARPQNPRHHLNQPEVSHVREMQSPDWLDRDEYPFRSSFLTTSHGDMHYIDEGSGEVILFVHGNPTWSFMYRHLIRGLTGRYRCIAPDHIGFGLSAKPRDASYLPQFHAENLGLLIETLALKNITLVIHDWGGAIGMAYALDHPHNVKRLIVFNNSFWSLKGVKGAERFSRIVGGPIGWFACCWLNAFPRFVIPSVMGHRSRLTNAIHRHYIRPFPTPTSRQGMWVLAKALVGESNWLSSLWAKRARLAGTPVQILCGLKDPTFGPEKLARWQEAFPRHITQTFPETGHFVAEELGPDAVAPIEAFLNAR